MVMQLLPYTNVHYPLTSEGDDLHILDLNLLGLHGQLDPIAQVEEEAQQELAAIEAEAQRKRAAVENRRIARITQVNLVREYSLFSENGMYKNIYPPAKDFIALVEREVSVMSFIKDPEISGPILRAAFTVIKIAGPTIAYAYILPPLDRACTQLVTNYLQQIPIVGSLLNKGLSVIKFPYDFVKWAWDPTKYWVQGRELNTDDFLGAPLFHDDGTPQMYETSRREETKVSLAVFGFCIAMTTTPILIPELIRKINELRANYLLNQDWARTFFASYFAWKIQKLKNIESQYSIPDVLQSDPILNQPRYRCAQSGQFLVIPFQTPSHRVFQYSVIEEWLLTHHTCPVTEPEQNLQANQLSFDVTTYNEIRSRLLSVTDKPMQLNP